MRRDINFFSVYRPSQSSSELDKFKILSLSLLAGSLVLILIIFSSLKITDLSVINNINSENAYLQNSSVSQAKIKLENTNEKIAALNSYKQAANETSSEYTKIPKIDSKVMKTIAGMQPNDVSAQNISYMGGVLSLKCQCTDSQSPANFVHALEKSGKFENVNYSGMSNGDEKSSGSGAYSFTVVITLKGGAEE